MNICHYVTPWQEPQSCHGRPVFSRTNRDALLLFILRSMKRCWKLFPRIEEILSCPKTNLVSTGQSESTYYQLAPFTWCGSNAIEEQFRIVTHCGSSYRGSGFQIMFEIFSKPRKLRTSSVQLGRCFYFCKQILSIVYSVVPYRSCFWSIFLLVICFWDLKVRSHAVQG